MNRASALYAQSLLDPNESVHAAVTANIFTHGKGHFPGVVAVTDRRILAACGMPGIQRQLSYPLEKIVMCEKAESPLTWRFAFHTKDNSFHIAVSPAVGKNLAPRIQETVTQSRSGK